MKGKKLLFLSLILALMAAVSIYNYLNEMEQISKAAAQLRTVIVATEDIPARTLLNTTMFTTIELPKDAIHANAVTDLSVLSGTYARDRLIAGEQVLSSRLVNSLGPSGLAYKVSAGHRALTLPVNNVSGVAGYILPGDFVDCILTIQPIKPAEGSQVVFEEGVTVTMVVASNVRVLAAGSFYMEQNNVQLPVDTLTLDTPAETVTTLIQASESGSLRMVLRPVEDSSGEILPPHRLNQFQ